MKKELKYFKIEGSYGGNQEWFGDFLFRLGGCGAETACEICIFFDKFFETKLYPFDVNSLSKKDYAAFGDIMKPYLHPRLRGIDRLDIYTKGFSKYISDKNGRIKLSAFSGEKSAYEAQEALKSQIDNGFPAAFLCLNHSDRRFKDYEWHWFIINGYDEKDGKFLVKAVTYSDYEWLDFSALWNTKRAQKGGMVFFSLSE
ncbi:MAG: hypothetical protein IKR97_02995 [Eubacterium sp.]|nr:hypothetical protein [Eubacterium sp.]